MTTHYYTHDIFIEHLVPDGHPERPDRIRVVHDALTSVESLDRRDCVMADESSFGLAHPDDYIRTVRSSSPSEGITRLDADTLMSPKSWDCVRYAVGGGLAAVDSVFLGDADNCLLIARPPGHHAERNRAMGFCLFNTAAIMARHAQKTHDIEKVAIIDFDVHHGNGTQDIFYDDPTVFYGSTHQMPLYPGTGAKDETGVGNICNAPLSPGTGGDGFREAYTEKVLVELDSFAPELIIISAGFDAHHRDPLANLTLTEDDFDWITGQLMNIASRHSDNRLVSLLEGGYDLDALASSCVVHANRLVSG